jgi:hypothetical protein
MAYTTPRLLGQNKPDALVNTNLFTVTTGNQVQFSLFVCNQDSEIDRFTVALIPAGEPETLNTYIAYRTPLIGNGVFAASGLYLNSGDQVVVESENGYISFTATGIEIAP